MNRDDVLRIVAEYMQARSDVVACYVFGSVARDAAHARSDVDIAVLFLESVAVDLSSPRFAVALELGGRLKKSVDVVSLKDAPPDLVHRVLRDGLIVYESDKAARIRFEVAARNAYFDLLPYLDRYRGFRPET